MTIHRYTIPTTGKEVVRVKVPKGYPHAGRWARASEETESHFTVTVPQKRRVASARIVPAQTFEVAKADL